MKTLVLNGIKVILGTLLLQFGSAAQAFTLISLPENLSTSSQITDSTRLNTEIQPTVNALKSHIFDARRKLQSDSTAQQNQQYASNSYAQQTSDLENFGVSAHSGGGAGSLQTLWLNSTFTAFENDFSRTKFDGDQHLLMGGIDFTLSDKYIFGVALGFETSNIDTEFNNGATETEGYSISPYFAVLLSDTWSFDLSIGIGEFNTDQHRAVGTGLLTVAVIESDFDSSRDFLSMNLTRVVARGNWYLTGSFGILTVNKEQDDYDELTAVEGLDLDMEQYNLAGEAAYSHKDGNSESYVGLIYEIDEDLEELTLTAGEQPENDDDSFLLMLGWRYYGSDLVANFEFNSRFDADDEDEYSIATTLRIDL